MLLFVNACVRGEKSRTLQLARHLLGMLHDERYVHLPLDELSVRPLDAETLSRRDILVQHCDFTDPIFDYARQWAEADTIVVAAPYWDLAFPAVLKAYLEQICVVGLTFGYTEEGQPKGLCRAKRLYYITTAGGIIPEQNFGFDYLRQLSETFFGIPEVRCIKAEQLDWVGADQEAILGRAMQDITDMVNGN